ncbi:MAG: DUF1080 domain-containing protein [Bryobacteraceae bacterium]
MTRMMLAALACAVVLGAQPNTLTPKEAADGWILLFDGESLFGWTQEGDAQWRVAEGVLVGDAGGNGWLRSNTEFADFILKCDYRTAADGNSGIFVRSGKERPAETGYEVQIWQQNPKFPTGSLVNHIKAKSVKPKPGEWHTFEIQAVGDRWTISLDGRKILDGRQGKSKIGFVGLQYNQGKKIEFRNIKLKPLGLNPIFDGKTLAGWKVVQPPRPPKEPAIWAVKDGMINVLHGGGQLETEAKWDDFVLQMDIRPNSDDPKRHPNSGVFFRGDAGAYWSGYESQIRNEYKEDRTKPVDFGTGAIYGRVAARKVVADDNQFFTKTLVARGRHMAVWVNGYQVTDWEDARPESANARQGAKLAAGTLSLQAHDPTTNLDFKNIRLAALPK